MKKLTLLLSILLLTLCLGAHMVQAEDLDDNDIQAPAADNTLHSPDAPGAHSNIPTLGNPLKAKSLTDLLYTLVDLLIFIGVIVAVFVFIFIGFKFVWAQGDPAALKEARKWFMYAVIGTAVLISSKVIVEVIKNTLTSAGVVDEKIWNNRP